jgi:hypothetical protein
MQIPIRLSGISCPCGWPCRPIDENASRTRRKNTGSLVDLKGRVVHFDFDPVPVFEAVVGGTQFTGELERIDLEIVLTGNGTESATLEVKPSGPHRFPFH